MGNEIQTTEPNNWIEAVQWAEPKFKEIAAVHNAVNWEAEANYARQMLTRNSYSMTVAKNNPASLRDAMINVGAIGLSLNPAEQLAYLVPRKPSKDAKPAICLDISYRGLIRLATDTGSIRWAKAEIVKEVDDFVYKGPATMPVHNMNPFSSRGKIVGVYCVAKTIDGDVLVDVMGWDEIEKTRATSMAFTNSNTNPWTQWPEEMTKKTIIKRASKTWPRSKQTRRYDAAVAVLNSHEGIDTDPEIGDAVRLYRAHSKDDEWTPDEMIAVKDAFMKGLHNRSSLEGANNHEKGKIRRIVQNAIMESPDPNSQAEVSASALLCAYHGGRETEVAETMNELNNDELTEIWLLIDTKTGQDLRGIQFKHQENAA